MSADYISKLIKTIAPVSFPKSARARPLLFNAKTKCGSIANALSFVILICKEPNLCHLMLKQSVGQ